MAVRLLLILAARTPLDMEHTHAEHAPPIRYALLLGGMLLTALMTLPVAADFRSALGTSVPLLIETVTPGMTFVMLLLLIVLYQLLAHVLAHHLNPVVALFIVGFGLSILALSVGGIDRFAWAEGSLWALGIETCLWSLVVLYMVWSLMRSSGGLPDVNHDWHAEPIGSWASLTSQPSLYALACGLLALPIAWLMLASTTPAQALGAAIVGAFLAGMLARVVAPKLDPILIYFGVVLAGGLAQLVIATGWSGSLADALVEGSAPRLVQIMPITWVAGSLIGVSMGIGWARSFVDDPSEERAVSATSRPA